MGPSQRQASISGLRGASEAGPRPAMEHPKPWTAGHHPPTLPFMALLSQPGLIPTGRRLQGASGTEGAKERKGGTWTCARGWGAVGHRLTPWGSLRPPWAQVHLGKVARPPGGLREGGSSEGPPQRWCVPPAPARPATVHAPSACLASDGACPQHLPGRFLQSARSLQPTRPHPIGCRFRPDPASSFDSQTRLPAPASLTLTLFSPTFFNLSLNLAIRSS